MTIQFTSFFTLKNLSSPLLNLGVPPGSQEGGERKICWIIRTNTAHKNCNWLASKTWSIQAKSSFPLKKVSLHLLNLGVPPVSLEGEERKIYWIILTNTAHENSNWLAS